MNAKPDLTPWASPDGVPFITSTLPVLCLIHPFHHDSQHSQLPISGYPPSPGKELTHDSHKRLADYGGLHRHIHLDASKSTDPASKTHRARPRG